MQDLEEGSFQFEQFGEDQGDMLLISGQLPDGEKDPGLGELFHGYGLHFHWMLQ